MDHWLMVRVLEGKSYDVIWEQPHHAAAEPPGASRRRPSRLRPRMAWRRMSLRPSAAARA